MRIRKIPTYLEEQADCLTELRLEQNEERYEGTHKERTGVVQSSHLGMCRRAYYTEYIGILAELIVRDILDKDPVVSEYTVSTFIKNADLVSNDCDIRYVANGENKRISVKGCEGALKANKQAINSEDATTVVFIKFIGKDSYEIHKYSPEQIKSWEVKSAFSEYYFNDLSKTL